MFSCGGRGCSGVGARGGAWSGGGTGGASAKLTKMLTGGRDLRRISLWPLCSVDLVWSGSLEMEEECPIALTMEWANVSSDELTLLSAKVARNWELAVWLA